MTMKRLLIGIAIGLVALRAAGGNGAEPDEERIKNGILGTWMNLSLRLPAQFKDVKSIKHVTSTHFTWVTYDTKKMTVLATAGGTWTLSGDIYREKCEFVSPGFDHLKGNEYAYILKYKGDELSIRSAPGTAIDVDETWRRLKRAH